MFYGVVPLWHTHKKQKHVVKVAREALESTFLLVGYITRSIEKEQPNNKEHAWEGDEDGPPPKDTSHDFRVWVSNVIECEINLT